jgi:DNA-binding MarR family transcriptional regulator
MGVMGKALSERLEQTRFEGPVHEALLNVLVAAGFLNEQGARIFAEHDLSPAQYNVLRILKGAHPEGYARCDIARRMIERAPDLTRMIDRLERRGLVERARSDQDRRRSVTRISRRGMELVEKMAPAVAAYHRLVSRRLTAAEAGTLSRLCEKLYAAG